MLQPTRTALFALLFLAHSGLAYAADGPIEINMGISSTENSQSLRSHWTPFLEDMEKATGLKVNGFYPSDYMGVIEAMRFNKVQIAWYGNAAAIQAVDRAQGEVFAQKTYANGEKGYYCLLIVNRDSPIQSLEDVLHGQGKYNLGEGDPNSVSGFLVPRYYVWAKNGIDPRTFFKNVVSGNAQANLLAVVNNQVDVATNDTEDLDNLKHAQPQKAAMIREIWRSEMVPADPFVWRRDLPDAAKEKIRTFFLSYGNDRAGADAAHERQVLLGLGGWGPFASSSDAQLLPIRQVMLFKEKLIVEQDGNLSAEEKAARVTKLDASLHSLESEIARAKAAAN